MLKGRLSVFPVDLVTAFDVFHGGQDLGFIAQVFADNKVYTYFVWCGLLWRAARICQGVSPNPPVRAVARTRIPKGSIIVPERKSMGERNPFPAKIIKPPSKSSPPSNTPPKVFVPSILRSSSKLHSRIDR